MCEYCGKIINNKKILDIDNEEETHMEIINQKKSWGYMLYVEIEGQDNDGYKYRGFIFNYNEEPYFIKQILFDEIKFENTDLIKEIKDELEYYKDKIITKKNEVFDYTETNNILNQYKFEED